MTRLVNPIPQYKPLSKIFFFKSGTNTKLVTYKDELESPGLENTHPIICDAAGNLPNTFFSGTAKMVALDQFDVQYFSRDPVNSEKELGDFTLWDTSVIYDINDIVEGSNGRFYQSLSNGNQGNDPTLIATSWKEIRFIGVWNTNVTYAIGDVVQTTNGNLWKAITATAGNDPSTDSGANWLPAIDGAKVPEVIALESLNKWETPDIVDFTAVAEEAYQIDASANTIDVTLPVLTIGDPFTFHNLITSTFKVQILNPIETIKGKKGDIAATINMEIKPGQSVQLVAKSTTILSIVGALVQ